MVSVTQGKHDTIVVVKHTGKEVRRFLGRRSLRSALQDFAHEQFGEDFEPRIRSGHFGTAFSGPDGVTYRATYSRAKKEAGK